MWIIIGNNLIINRFLFIFAVIKSILMKITIYTSIKIKIHIQKQPNSIWNTKQNAISIRKRDLKQISCDSEIQFSSIKKKSYKKECAWVAESQTQTPEFYFISIISEKKLHGKNFANKQEAHIFRRIHRRINTYEQTGAFWVEWEWPIPFATSTDNDQRQTAPWCYIYTGSRPSLLHHRKIYYFAALTQSKPHGKCFSRHRDIQQTNIRYW